jgi:hypothetical protein
MRSRVTTALGAGRFPYRLDLDQRLWILLRHVLPPTAGGLIFAAGHAPWLRLRPHLRPAATRYRLPRSKWC